MSFAEVRFPEQIAYDSEGGPGYDTAITAVDSGAEERVSRREDARLQFNARTGLTSSERIGELLSFYRVLKGAAVGFRFLDPGDYSSAANHRGGIAFDDVELGLGDGASLQFPLLKRYDVAGAGQVVRRIEKPIDGEALWILDNQVANVLVGIDGVEQTSGWSVDRTTGVVTFATAPADGQVVTAGFYFDVPVRFQKELDTRLLVSYRAHENEEIPDVPIVELVDETPIPPGFYAGGAYDHGDPATTVVLSLADGILQVFNPQAGAMVVMMPDPAALYTGGPYWYVQNKGSQPIDLRDHLNLSFASLAAGTTLRIFLSLDSGGLKAWVTA